MAHPLGNLQGWEQNSPMASHSAVAHFNGYSSVSFSGHSLLQSLQH